jgi:hypothetical protein
MLLKLLILITLCTSLYANEQEHEFLIAENTNKELNLEPIRDTVLGELNAIAQDDIPRAYFAYTTKAFRDKTPLETFSQFVRGHAGFWNYPSFQWDNIVYYEDVAVVRASFNLNGKSRNGTFFLKQENGVWKIMGMTMVDTTPAAPVNQQQNEDQ